MAEKTILLDIADRVATIVIAREQRRNSVDNDALEQIRVAVESIRRQQVAVIVIAGQGTKAFCAGSDLRRSRAIPSRTRGTTRTSSSAPWRRSTNFPARPSRRSRGSALAAGWSSRSPATIGSQAANRDSAFRRSMSARCRPAAGRSARRARSGCCAHARCCCSAARSTPRRRSPGVWSARSWRPARRSKPPRPSRGYASNVDPGTVALLKRVIMGGYDTPARTGSALAYLADYALVQSASFKQGVGGFADRGKPK